MYAIVVQDQAKREQADESERLVDAVFTELNERQPETWPSHVSARRQTVGILGRTMGPDPVTRPSLRGRQHMNEHDDISDVDGATEDDVEAHCMYNTDDRTPKVRVEPVTWAQAQAEDVDAAAEQRQSPRT